jgi:3-hydroxyacyl-CoA dehydrogenase
MQTNCVHPERVLVGHPFNPPHVIPLVEVVGGAKTSDEAVRKAMAFYSSIGKKAIHLKKELPGHVANRLQSALYREVLYLIEQDVLSVEDADAAVSYGPGPRWGVMGPSLQWHLGGGQGGIKHFIEHLLPPMVQSWKVLGTRPSRRSCSGRSPRVSCARPPAARSSSWRGENETIVELLRLRAQQELRPQHA